MFQNRVELYATPTGANPMDLFRTLTSEYAELNGNPDYMARMPDANTIVVLHSSGIVVEARWHGNFMNVYIEAPGRLQGTGRVLGICGNFDGNPNNDFFNRATPGTPVSGNPNSGAVQAALQSCELHSYLNWPGVMQGLKLWGKQQVVLCTRPHLLNPPMYSFHIVCFF